MTLYEFLATSGFSKVSAHPRAPYTAQAKRDGIPAKLVYWGEHPPELIPGRKYMVEIEKVKGNEFTLSKAAGGGALHVKEIETAKEMDLKPQELEADDGAAILVADPNDHVKDQISLTPIPIADIRQITHQFRTYQYVLNELVDASDWVSVRGKRFLKKSGFRKLAAAFHISTELLEKEDFGDGWMVIVRATLPNGRHADGVGICEAGDKNNEFRSKHDLFATAYTRAANRAISDLVGMGIVSLEELDDAP